MGFWSSFCEPPAEQFPNRLLGGTAVAVRRRRMLIALLLLICLIPRVWVAWNWRVCWSDSVWYFQLSEHLGRGEYAQAFGELGLNVYPLILLWLRGTGLDWMVVGQWWSVLMASAVVLPLFGWIRRQFDDQVAVAACLLYALHPKLVAYSPLIIRDSTFWLLFNLSLYLVWRAVTEVRWWLFLTAGLALTLAVHTRSEGWALLIPVVLWSAFRLPSIAGSRRRLVLGTLACLAVIPASVTVVNVTWLRNSPHWEMIRASHVDIVRSWFHCLQKPRASKPATVAPHAPRIDKPQARKAATVPAPRARIDLPPRRALAPPPGREPLSGFTLNRKLAVRYFKAYTYAYGFLGLVGMWGWWRVYFRREHQTLLLMGLSLIAAIWVRYSQVKLDVRYFLPIVLISFPWMGLGLFWIADRVQRRTRRYLTWNRSQRAALLVGILITVGLIGTLDLGLPVRRMMQNRTELGKWVLENVGPNQRIAGNASGLRLVGYYAEGHVRGCPFVQAFKAWRPRVVVLRNDTRNRSVWAASSHILETELGLRYRPVPHHRLPPGSEEILLFVRDEHSRCVGVFHAARRRDRTISR